MALSAPILTPQLRLTGVLDLICKGMSGSVARFDVGQGSLTTIPKKLEFLRATCEGRPTPTEFSIVDSERGIIQFDRTNRRGCSQPIPIGELEDALGVRRLPEDCTVKIDRLTSLWKAPTPPQALIEIFSALKAAGASLEFIKICDRSLAGSSSFFGTMGATFSTDGVDMIFNAPINFKADVPMFIDGKEGPMRYELASPGKENEVALSLMVLLGDDLKKSANGYDRLREGLKALLGPMVFSMKPLSVCLHYHPPRDTEIAAGELELVACGKRSKHELQETERALQMDMQGTYLGNIPEGHYLVRSYNLKAMPQTLEEFPFVVEEVSSI